MGGVATPYRPITWIHTEDCLPQLGRWVLIALAREDEVQLGQRRGSEKDSWWYDRAGMPIMEPDKVCAWAPLPRRPKLEKPNGDKDMTQDARVLTEEERVKIVEVGEQIYRERNFDPKHVEEGRALVAQTRQNLIARSIHALGEGAVWSSAHRCLWAMTEMMIVISYCEGRRRNPIGGIGWDEMVDALTKSVEAKLEQRAHAGILTQLTRIADRLEATKSTKEKLSSLQEEMISEVIEDFSGDHFETMIERLADLEHRQWIHWTKYMLDTIDAAQEEDIEHVGFAKALEGVERWRRQIETPYAELTALEQRSDIGWAVKAGDIMIECLTRMSTPEGRGLMAKKKKPLRMIKVPVLPRITWPTHTPIGEEIAPWKGDIERFWKKMMDEQQLPSLTELKEGKRPRYLQAFATLTRAKEVLVWHGHDADPEYTDRIISAGTRVRIIMASRFGDLGITDDLNAPRGYDGRIQVIDQKGEPCTEFTDIEWFEYKEPQE